MKRIIALMMAVIMCLSMAACGGTNSDDGYESQLAESQAKVEELETKLAEAEAKIEELESQVNKVGDNTSQQQEDSVEKSDEFVKLNIGDTITLDFVEFTVDSTSWSDDIKPTDTSSVYSYMSDKEDESYFWICGTMKNISGNAYSVENMVSEIVFDDKYTYTAHLAADDGGHNLYGDYVKPLSSVKYYIYVSAPDEIKETYSTVTVKFGFKDSFSGSYYDDFKECNYLYTISLNK
mgnify:CR=1 FL=1